jgi:hypothetical protein
MSDSKELATFNANDLALLSGYDQDDDFKSGDLSYASIIITQSNSPQATIGHESYIEGVTAGVFINSITGFNHGPELKVVYLKFFHSYSLNEPDGKNKQIRPMTEDEFEAGKADGSIIFIKKGDGGFKGKSSFYLGDNLVKVYSNYMVMLPDYPEDGAVRIKIGAGGTAHTKKWNTMLSNTFVSPGKKAPKFAFVWKLTLSLEMKPDGNYFTIGTGAKTTVEKVGPTPSSFLPQVIAGYTWFQGLDAKVVDAAEHATPDDNPL